MITVLMEASAKVDSRMLNEETSLYAAAMLGHVDVVKELIRAKAIRYWARRSRRGALLLRWMQRP